MPKNDHCSLLALAGAALAVGMLSGCTAQADPPGDVTTRLPSVEDPVAQVALDEAEAHYGDLLREVTGLVDAATGVPAEWTSEYEASASGSDAGCAFSTERLRADVDVDAATWSEIADAVAPVLEGRGFTEPVEGDGTGGWLSLSAQDPSGAVFELRSKGRVDVDVDGALVSADGDCTLTH
ncbi:hypothetical protein [Antribacter gilvus]|uniref:hypothetical protein n=1 Tax=Antribacter gilvus TaxID=2304675 RepID=UPI000F77A407|nr:hypothetical protein [Antribacter gilvus]